MTARTSPPRVFAKLRGYLNLDSLSYQPCAVPPVAEDARHGQGRWFPDSGGSYEVVPNRLHLPAPRRRRRDGSDFIHQTNELSSSFRHREGHIVRKDGGYRCRLIAHIPDADGPTRPFWTFNRFPKEVVAHLVSSFGHLLPTEPHLEGLRTVYSLHSDLWVHSDD